MTHTDHDPPRDHGCAALLHVAGWPSAARPQSTVAGLSRPLESATPPAGHPYAHPAVARHPVVMPASTDRDRVHSSFRSRIALGSFLILIGCCPAVVNCEDQVPTLAGASRAVAAADDSDRAAHDVGPAHHVENDETNQRRKLIIRCASFDCSSMNACRRQLAVDAGLAPDPVITADAAAFVDVATALAAMIRCVRVEDWASQSIQTKPR